MNFPSASVDKQLSAAPNIDYIFLKEISGTLTIRVKNPSQCPKLFNALVAMGEEPVGGGTGVPEPVYEDDDPLPEEDYQTRYTKLLDKISLLCASHCADCQRNIFKLINDEVYIGGDDDPDDFAVALRSLHNNLLNSPIHDVEQVIQKTFPQDAGYDKIKEAVLALEEGHFFAMCVGSTGVFAHSITIGEGNVAERITQLRAYYNKKNIY